MKLALIPPRGYEDYASRSDIHLTLSIPECMDNVLYMDTYEELRQRGDFIIVDNGAAEGYRFSMEQIANKARRFWPDEIVLPDVLGDAQQTASAVNQFITYQARKGDRFMLVAHGRKYPDIVSAVSRLIDQYPMWIKTIGIPRYMVDADNLGASGRITLATMLCEKLGYGIDIHLLGANPVWLREIRAAAKYAPFIRSVDTSAPFNYAIQGRSVNEAQGVSRPTNYFTRAYEIDKQLLDDNIDTMMEWVKAK